MNVNDWIGERFDEHRIHLQGVARQMLGPSEEADAAVRAARARLTELEGQGSEGLHGWFTMTLAVVCIDMLWRRMARRAEPAIWTRTDVTGITPAGGSKLYDETLLADSVSLALFALLEGLSPPERMAFVLDKAFGLSVAEIARVVGGSPESVMELAKRARCRVQGDTPHLDCDLDQR